MVSFFWLDPHPAPLSFFLFLRRTDGKVTKDGSLRLGTILMWRSGGSFFLFWAWGSTWD